MYIYMYGVSAWTLTLLKDDSSAQERGEEGAGVMSMFKKKKTFAKTVFPLKKFVQLTTYIAWNLGRALLLLFEA